MSLSNATMKKRKHSVHLTWKDYETVVTLFKENRYTMVEIGVKTGLCRFSVFKIMTEYLAKDKTGQRSVYKSGLKDYMNGIRREEQMKFRYEQYKTILP